LAAVSRVMKGNILSRHRNSGRGQCRVCGYEFVVGDRYVSRKNANKYGPLCFSCAVKLNVVEAV